MMQVPETESKTLQAQPDSKSKVNPNAQDTEKSELQKEVSAVKANRGRKGQPRRDFHSSFEAIQYSKATEEVTYSWKNLNVWSAGSTAAAPGLPAAGEGDASRDFGGKLLSYVGWEPKVSKHLLKNVTGAVRPGELCAIVGSSGAGKSTLLNVLNFRNTKNLKVTGEREVNGVAVSPNSMTSVSAYIQQDDLFIGSLTVREHLIFQSLLRMHRHIPYKDRLARVEEVILEMGLSKCADAQIGYPTRIKGISGGEMKRLAFASELLTDPPLFFCDEPTSGLDSFMSQNVVSVLKGMSANGKTIICTIHQPSSQTFEMFDHVLLMAEGRVAFMGKATAALKFFKANGNPCPLTYNPSDFYVMLLAIEPELEDECRERVKRLCDAYEASEDGLAMQALATHENPDPEVATYLAREDQVNCKSPYRASWISQFRAVFWRSILTILKDPIFIRVNLMQNALMSLILGGIFYGQEFNFDGLQNIGGALFMAVMNLTFGNAMTAFDVFVLELPIFLREHYNGMYRTDVYFLTKTIAEFPFYIFSPFLSVSVFYFMIGLQRTVEAFFMTVAIGILTANVAVSFGYLISCIAPTIAVAMGLASVIILPLALFGGLYLNIDSIKAWLQWLKWLSWFYYANEALNIIQWRHVDVKNVPCGNGSDCSVAGSLAIEKFGYKEAYLEWDIWALFVLVCAFRIAAFMVLLAKAYRRK